MNQRDLIYARALKKLRDLEVELQLLKSELEGFHRLWLAMADSGAEPSVLSHPEYTRLTVADSVPRAAAASSLPTDEQPSAPVQVLDPWSRKVPCR